MQNQKPNILKIIKSDYLSNIAMKITSIFWIILTVVVFINYSGRGKGVFAFKEDAAQSLFLFAVAATLCTIPLLFLRYMYFARLLSIKEDIKGRISQITFRGTRGYVTYSYTVDDQQMSGFNAIYKNDQTKALREGSEISILVDPKNTKKTYIRELFT